MEYCFTQDGTRGGAGMLVACQPGTQGAWGHDLDYNLGTVNGGTYATVYGEYRLVVGSNGNYTAYPSYPSSASVYVYVASTTGVSLNAPAGLLNTSYASAGVNGGLQPQYLNYAAGQWVSWAISGGTNLAIPFVCPSSGSCAQLNPGNDNFYGPPYSYDWNPGTEGYANGAYIEFAPLVTGPTPPSTFYQFTPGSSYPGVTCNPAVLPPSGPMPASGAVSVPCKVLADGSGGVTNNIMGDIPGDPPGGPTGPNGYVFAGYADPCMRADALIDPVANPAGDNLYMTYSFAKLNTVTSTTPTPSLEIHLASSTSGGAGHPGGWQWSAYCNPNDNPSTCPLATPIYPSPTTSSSSGHPTLLFNGTVWVLTSPQTGNPSHFQQVTGDYYSSHEVSNLAQYVNGSTAYWYAVHLMYFIPVGYTVQNGVINGCLVISTVTGSPGALEWPNYTDQNPADCNPANFASSLNSYPMTFGTAYSQQYTGYPDLNVLAGGSSGPGCLTWGEPAIMVAPSPAGSSNPMALYLAAECFTQAQLGYNTYTGSTGYYVFYNTINPDGSVSPGAWNAYTPSGSIMHFTIANLPPGSPTNYQSGSFLTELDLAIRADNTMVAVATPEYVAVGAQPTQYGCFVLGFDLSAPTNPFTSFVALVNDVDTSDVGDNYKEPSPNACTYEPKSNTGVPIVRHLVSKNAQFPTQFQIYSIIDSGVMP